MGQYLYVSETNIYCDSLSITTIDDKWRVTIPKEARRAMRLSRRVPVTVKLKKHSLVIQSLRKSLRRREKDSLEWLMMHPARADPKRIKKVDLEKVEDEMWLP